MYIINSTIPTILLILPLTIQDKPSILIIIKAKGKSKYIFCLLIVRSLINPEAPKTKDIFNMLAPIIFPTDNEE